MSTTATTTASASAQTNSTALKTTTLGFPRMGAHRELKWALEQAWRTGTFDDLRATATELRRRHWQLQAAHDISSVPVGDFSYFDHVLDTALALGAVPDRFGGTPFNPESGRDADLARYFTMARGGTVDGAGVAALELTKWFDTNYHYLVPELRPDQSFAAQPDRLLAHAAEARSLGLNHHVVLLGPVTFLALSKRTDGGEPLELLDALLPAYVGLVSALAAAGVSALQIDEPVLVTDLPDGADSALRRAFAAIREATPGVELTLSTYFGSLGQNAPLATSLPIDVLHVDLVRAPEQLAELLASAPQGWDSRWGWSTAATCGGLTSRR